MGSLAENLTPPYYTAVLNENKGGLKDAEHVAPTDEMVTIATRQPGFLGLETTRDKKGDKIMVSYWRDVDAIEGWINVGEVHINRKPLFYRLSRRPGRPGPVRLVEHQTTGRGRENGPGGVAGRA